MVIDSHGCNVAQDFTVWITVPRDKRWDSLWIASFEDMVVNLLKEARNKLGNFCSGKVLTFAQLSPCSTKPIFMVLVE
jgi:hypothetical protein